MPNYLSQPLFVPIQKQFDLDDSAFPIVLIQPLLLQHYSGYSLSDIGNCIQDLHRTFAMAEHRQQQAIRIKYSSDK